MSDLNTTPQVEQALIEEAEKVATKDTLALVGFVLGLVGSLSGLYPPVAWPLDIVGVAFSTIGFSSKHQGVFAKAGIILGTLGIIGTTIIFILSDPNAA